MYRFALQRDSQVTPLQRMLAANPFSAQQLSGGYDLASYGKDAEGSCGDKSAEGSCGENKAEGADDDEKKAEGKCGEGKCGAGEESCLSPTEGWREPVSG